MKKTLRRFLYEQGPQSEYYLRKYDSMYPVHIDEKQELLNYLVKIKLKLSSSIPNIKDRSQIEYTKELIHETITFINLYKDQPNGKENNITKTTM